MSKIKLNTNEENELGFNLKIEGPKDSLKSTPKVRFALTEKKTDKGWLFPIEKGEGDSFSVIIPPLRGMIEEGKEYNGKLEVVLGEHYFTPTVVDVEFTEPLKVEASITNKNSKKSILEEKTGNDDTVPLEEEIEQTIRVEGNISEIKNKKVNTESIQKIIKEERLSYSDLSPKEKAQVNKLFLAKCKQIDPENMDTAKKVSDLMKEGTDYTKKRLTALISQSTKEYLENKLV